MRIHAQLRLFQMSQREKITVAVSDVCSPLPATCWPVSFQAQLETQKIVIMTN